MARIRSVHPGLFTDEGFVSCSAFARLLVIGIWTECDDQGIFEWKPVGLKMRILPVDNVDLPALLDELERNNIVARFSSGSKDYGAVRNFRKYQKPKKPNSVHPLPDEFRTYVALSDASSELEGDEAGPGGEPEPPKTPPVPPKGGIQFQMEDGGGRVEKNPPLSPPEPKPGSGVGKPPQRDVLQEPKFEELRSVFPKRDGGHPLKDAIKAWNAAIRSGCEPDAIISAAKRYHADQHRKGKIGTVYVKSLGPWLNLREFGSPPSAEILPLLANGQADEIVEMQGRKVRKSRLIQHIEDWKQNRNSWNESLLGFPPDWPSCPVPTSILNECGLQRVRLAEASA